MYYVHAVETIIGNEILVAVREPGADPLVPYFYSLSNFTVLDASIPEEFGISLDETPGRPLSALIAPMFWSADRLFYEKLIDANPFRETDPTVALFRSYLIQAAGRVEKNVRV
ncbi:MAG: hypothetical protein AAFR38_05645 [Planctomycetota bacterium]